MSADGPAVGRKRRLSPAEGGISVFAANEQAAQPVDAGRWVALAEDVLDAEGIRGEAELTLLFVDETVMAELNERFMGVAEPTDVLAFPIDDDLIEPGRWPDSGTTGPDRNVADPGDAPLLLGDVVVCPAVAARNAPTHAGSYDDEVALLIVHGILHVLGMDHAEPEEAAAMQHREQELLSRFHRR